MSLYDRGDGTAYLRRATPALNAAGASVLQLGLVAERDDVLG